MSTFLKKNKYQLKALSFLYFGVLLYLTFFIARRYEPIDFRGSLNLKLFDKLNADHLNRLRFQNKVNLGLDVIGNFLLFIPFPLALCFLVGKKLRNIEVLMAILAATTSIEIFQYVFNRGVADVDDIFLNFFGGATGLVIINFIYKRLGDENPHFWN